MSIEAARKMCIPPTRRRDAGAPEAECRRRGPGRRRAAIRLVEPVAGPFCRATADPRRSRQGREPGTRGSWRRCPCCTRRPPEAPPCRPSWSGAVVSARLRGSRQCASRNHATVARNPSGSGVGRTSGNSRHKRVWSACEWRHVARARFDVVALELMADDFFEQGDDSKQRHPRSVGQIHRLRIDHAATNGIGEHRRRRSRRR